PEALRGVIVGGGLMLVGLVLPISLSRLAWRRRRRALALLALLVPSLLLLWALLGYFAGALLGQPVALLLVLAALFDVPPRFVVGARARWAVRRRWQRAALLLGFGFLVPLVGAGVWLAADVRQMDASEHYSYGGWYSVALLGIYAVGALLLAWGCLRSLFR